MAEENAPPPAGGEVETAKKKLRLKVTRVEENQPRVRRRIFTPKPAIEPGTEGVPPATEGKRVGAGRILTDLGKRLWEAAKGWNRNVWIGIGAAIGIMILYGAWTEWRKTVVRVRVELNEVRLGDKPEVLVLYDFTERLAGLRRDYGRRLAPLRPQIREIERTLILAKADAAGTAEKSRLLQSTIKKDTEKTSSRVTETKKALDRLYYEEADVLDDEFETKRLQFMEDVETKARSLGLFYHLEDDPSLQQPEVAANEFRLSLYRAPPNLNLSELFGWMEKKLKGWHDFEKDWRQRYDGLRIQAENSRRPLTETKNKDHDYVLLQREELKKFQQDAQTIEREIEDYEKQLLALRQKEQDAKTPFEEDVNAIPDAFLCVRVPLDADAAPIVVQGKLALAAPGTLQVVIRGKKNGQTAWVIRPLQPVSHQKTEVIFRDEDFQPISDWLETD